MAQLTWFEWKLSHLSPAFCIWRRWRNSRFWAIYFDIRVPNLTCHQHRENKLSSANSIGSFTNFQLLVSCNRPSITNLKMKFFYPIFRFPFSWLKLGNPLNSFLVLSTGKIWKVHPATKLGMPPTQGKQYCPLPTALAASQLSASRLLQSPQHPTPQNEVLLPHL